MPSIADLDELLSLASSTGNCETEFFHKTTFIGGTATDVTTTFMTGREMSLWRQDGVPSGGITGDIATSGTTGSIPTSGTTGSMPVLNAQNGNDKWLIQTSGVGSIGGTYILYDRLYHNRNLSGTSLVEQTVQGDPAFPAITRYTDGVGNMVFLEIYTTIGATLTTVKMTYTNQDGVTGCVSELTGIGSNGRRESPRTIPMPLKKGDTGVRAVKSVTLTATTGTVGDFGVTIAHPLAMFGGNGAGICGWRDYTTGVPGIPKILDNACLAWMFMPTTSTVPEFFGSITMVET
jgi:hypothetical protein